MKTALIIGSLLLLLGIGGCSRNSDSRNPLLGRYELVGRDNSGQIVFTGTMLLKSLEQNYLKGQCSIIKLKSAPEGLMENDGSCEGLVEGKSLSMDLAPSLDDAGLLLEGEINDGAIRGAWKLDGFFTSESLGRFEAVKKG